MPEPTTNDNRNATLGAGTKSYWRPVGSTEWKKCPGLISIGDVGEEAPTLEQTTLEDTAKRYMAGIFDGPDKELKGRRYPINTHQNEFVGAARATELVEIRHEWPTTPLMSAEYEIALLGYRVVETSNAETVNFVVKGKQNGHVKWNDSDTAAFPGDTEASGENP